MKSLLYYSQSIFNICFLLVQRFCNHIYPQMDKSYLCLVILTAKQYSSVSKHACRGAVSFFCVGLYLLLQQQVKYDCEQKGFGLLIPLLFLKTFGQKGLENCYFFLILNERFLPTSSLRSKHQLVSACCETEVNTQRKRDRIEPCAHIANLVFEKATV